MVKCISSQYIHKISPNKCNNIYISSNVVCSMYECLINTNKQRNSCWFCVSGESPESSPLIQEQFEQLRVSLWQKCLINVKPATNTHWSQILNISLWITLSYKYIRISYPCIKHGVPPNTHHDKQHPAENSPFFRKENVVEQVVRPGAAGHLHGSSDCWFPQFSQTFVSQALRGCKQSSAAHRCCSPTDWLTDRLPPALLPPPAEQCCPLESGGELSVQFNSKGLYWHGKHTFTLPKQVWSRNKKSTNY